MGKMFFPPLGKSSLEFTGFPKLKHSGNPRSPPHKKDKRAATKGHREILGGGEYVCHLDCNDGITGVNIMPKVIKLCTKYVESFYMNYTSLELSKTNKHKAM